MYSICTADIDNKTAYYHDLQCKVLQSSTKILCSVHFEEQGRKYTHDMVSVIIL